MDMEHGKEVEAKPDNGAEATGGIVAQDVTDVEPIAEAKPPEDADAEAQENGGVPALSELVDSDLLNQLLEMGFKEARAGRALLATKGQANLEAALSWIESHEDDSDIDEPLTAEQLLAHKAPPKSPLSEEEAQRLAYELQKRLREERLKREKQEAIEKERLRLQQSKAMLEQNAKLEEEARKRAIAKLQREKEEAKKERERQRELLRQDYRDRFGCEMPDDMAQADPDERVAKMSGKEKVAFFSNAIFKRYKKDEAEKLLVCLATLRVYIVNAKDNPTEPKYHRIRKENPAFKARVLPCEGSLELLDACGFKNQGDVLAIEGQPDGFVLAQAVKFLDVLIGQLKS